MNAIKNIYNKRTYQSKIFNEYFKGLNIAFYDIETTGLNALSSKIIVGGMLIPHKDNLEVYQYFADDVSHEQSLLEAYCRVLSDADVLISYNGKAFDLPFLRQRLNRHNLNINLEACQSFDIYRALHLYSRFREILPNLKQKTIETYLGLASYREDEISGSESIKLYNEYCRTHSMELRNKILLHNHDDLIQLSNVLSILDKLDLHKILYNEGFTVALDEKRVYIQEIVLRKKHIQVTGVTRNIPLDYYSFEVGYHAVHLAREKTLTLEIPFEIDNGIFLIDLESFPMNFSILEKYPNCVSGYLVLNKYNNLNYAEINNFLKVIIKEIMRFF